MSYTAAYVFGDSLVDAGNVLKLARKYDSLPFTSLPEGAPTAESGYVEGRFSNGYTFTDLIANKTIGTVTKPVFPYGFEDPWLGLPISPFKSDPKGNNLNFAYGGAQIRQGSEVVPDLDGQTDALRHAVDGRAPSEALYLVTIGGNDVRSLAPAGSDPATVATAHARLSAAADTMLTELGQLMDAGALNFLITGVPDVGVIPAYDVDANLVLDPNEQLRASTATQYSAFLDTLLRDEVVNGLRSRGALVTYAPLADYVGPQGEHIPGILNLNLPTVAGLHGVDAENLSGNLLQYQDLLFFDEVHPTGQLHALVGATMYAQLTGTPWIETLPLRAPEVDFFISGSIAAPGETDALTVALVKGTTYTFDMLGISSLGIAGELGDTSLGLLSDSGTLLAADDDSGAGFDARLGITAATSGTYLLELGATGSLTGTYVLQAAIDGAALAAGNTYHVASASTLVLEPIGGLGADYVLSSVSYTVAETSEIEVLKATGSPEAAIDLTGNQFNQRILGNDGANTLAGRGGVDLLWGREGQDTFRFDTVLDGSVDVIKDFDARYDVIALDHAIFGGIPGALPAEAFRRGAAAADLDDRIVHDPQAKALYYDPDGAGPQAAIQFATLYGSHVAVDATDFILV